MSHVSPLLSSLRLCRTPYAADIDDLLSEARFFPPVDLLLFLLLPPPPPPRTRPLPLPPPPDRIPLATLAVTHGGVVSSFDPSLLLLHRRAALAPFPAVDFLLALSPSLAVLLLLARAPPPLHSCWSLASIPASPASSTPSSPPANLTSPSPSTATSALPPRARDLQII